MRVKSDIKSHLEFYLGLSVQTGLPLPHNGAHIRGPSKHPLCAAGILVHGSTEVLMASNRFSSGLVSRVAGWIVLTFMCSTLSAQRAPIGVPVPPLGAGPFIL